MINRLRKRTASYVLRRPSQNANEPAMQRLANRSQQVDAQAQRRHTRHIRSNMQWVASAAQNPQPRTALQSRASSATAPNIIRTHLQIIKRQKSIIVLATFLVVLLMFVFAAAREPLFSATTRIQIEKLATQIDERGKVIYATPRSQRDLNTLHQLLASRSVAGRVARKLNLIRDRGFLAQSRSASWQFDPNIRTSANVISTTNIGQSLEDRVLDLLVRHRRIRPVEGSRLIDISYSDADPRRAKRIADAFADAFIASNLERQKTASTVSKRLIETQITHFRKRLRNSEQLLMAFADRHHALVGSELSEAPINSVMETNATLASLTAIPDRSERHWNRANHIRVLSRAGRSRLSMLYTPVIRAFVQGQPAHYQILRRNVDADRKLYDGLLRRYNDVAQSARVGINKISIVDRAVAPTHPSSASIAQVFFISLAFGLGLGLTIAYIRDTVSDRLRSPEDVERRLAIPVLTKLPKFRSTTSPLPQLTDPSNPFSEACRTLATALQDPCNLDSGRIVCVSSAGPGEGKSTVAFTLARQLAVLGDRVLLIDADLGNPTLHKFLFQRNETGLSDFLAASGKSQDLIKSTDLTGLAFVPAGKVYQNPSRLLASPDLRSLFIKAADVFDLVIIDAPSLTGTADVKLIRRAGASLLLVIAASQVNAAALRCALRHHAPTMPPIIGTVLNKYGRHSIHHRRALRPNISWPRHHLEQ